MALKSADVFLFLEVMFLFSSFRGRGKLASLGEIWAKMVPEVL